MNHQPQRLIVCQDSAGWIVRGEGVTFFCACADREQALLIAHTTRRDWYPRARVIAHKARDAMVVELEEERRKRLEWRDQMIQDQGLTEK